MKKTIRRNLLIGGGIIAALIIFRFILGTQQPYFGFQGITSTSESLVSQPATGAIYTLGWATNTPTRTSVFSGDIQYEGTIDGAGYTSAFALPEDFATLQQNTWFNASVVTLQPSIVLNPNTANEQTVQV